MITRIICLVSSLGSLNFVGSNPRGSTEGRINGKGLVWQGSRLARGSFGAFKI